MKSIPTTRAERGDPQEKGDLIREINRMLRRLEVKQLQRIVWYINDKWGC